MSHYRSWSPEDDEAIIKAPQPLDVPGLAQKLDRSAGAVLNRAFKLGVSTARERLRHKGNSAVRQEDIDKAVALYKQYGSGVAASKATKISYGRINYLLKLARRYGYLPPIRASIGELNEKQKIVYDWIVKHPGEKAIVCINYFARQGFNYYEIQYAHEQLRKKNMIVRKGINWTAVKNKPKPKTKSLRK